MADTSGNRPKKHICMGLLAHVDAGKTTLSEGLLYAAGSIRILGRVDKKDAFLDTYRLEKERGITIFSKQARLTWKDTKITLLDTPGHVDFSAEMERTLQVLDYGILVINGSNGVQGHTRTLWRLLEKYKIPVFIFINKMDQGQREKEELLKDLQHHLDVNCIDFGENSGELFLEQVSMCREELLEQYLETGGIRREDIVTLVSERKVFPCYFGSALKLDGVGELLDGLDSYASYVEYPKEFGARIFKISRDDQGNRVTFLKVTGGGLKVRDLVASEQGDWVEKVSQIRLYSGAKYDAVQSVGAGDICGVTGLNKTYPGEGLGVEGHLSAPLISPVLTYRIQLPVECDAAVILPKLRILEEEDPMLHLVWREQSSEILVQVMGEVQIEVLKSMIEERFGIPVEFTSGSIVYKETIGNRVEGVGHFEPLRHYAEVHLIMEPGEAGSGLVFDTVCSEDDLDRSWQRLVLTHLAEREHVGVVCGAPITDIKITLAAGRAHSKHTEGGDFRQATYRAVRQGLMQAESKLLEPFYDFVLEVPEGMVGRAMTDMEAMSGTFLPPEFTDGTAVMTGSVPVATLGEYQRTVAEYTRGYGRLFCTMKGYGPCHNTEEVKEKIGYDPIGDMDNPSGSVFCAHGAGFTVGWEQVPEYMHLESCLAKSGAIGERKGESRTAGSAEIWIGEEEVEQILNKASFANQGKEKKNWKKSVIQRAFAPSSPQTYKKAEKREPYLLVDGYNIIFAWDELRALAEVTIDGAKGKLLDILCNFQAMRGMKLIAVFDAYRVLGHAEEVITYHNILVVYTKEAETADQYIEKFAHVNGKAYDITVATSDGLEQIIIMGQGCRLLSARELKTEVELVERQITEEYLEPQKKMRNLLGDVHGFLS